MQLTAEKDCLPVGINLFCAVSIGLLSLFFPSLSSYFFSLFYFHSVLIQFAPLSRCNHPASYFFPYLSNSSSSKVEEIVNSCTFLCENGIKYEKQRISLKKENNWHVHIEINVINGVSFILSVVINLNMVFVLYLLFLEFAGVYTQLHLWTQLCKCVNCM